MDFKNIFNKPVENVSYIKTENPDFDFSTYCMEMLMTLESAFFDINSNHLYATYLGNKDGTPEILTEGFNDFINSVVAFFERIIKAFKDFLKKAMSFINAYIGDFDKFIATNKSTLLTLNPDFTIRGYKYTINNGIPRLDKINNIISSYNHEISNISELKKADILKEREEFMSGDVIGRIRADILGMSGEIAQEDFADYAKKAFRGGQNDQMDINVDKSLLQKTISEYEQLKKLLDTTMKETEHTINLVNSMKNFFEKSASVYYKGTEKTIGMSHIDTSSNGGIKHEEKKEIGYDMGKLDVINTFFNFKFVQSKELGNLSIMAMTEKVNAIKEALKLSKQIIRQSFYKQGGN